MNPYQTRSIEGLSGVELTIALYDGIIRFLYQAIAAVENRDTGRRRAAVKRAFDILMYLQATLRTDVGGKPAEALGDFYVAMFALILQGSQQASAEKFRKAINCVMNVRGAWRQVVNDPAVSRAASYSPGVLDDPAPILPRELDQPPESGPHANWLA